MREVYVAPGEHINDAAARLANAAPAFMLFNDIRVEAEPGMTAESLIAVWDAQMKARAGAYQNSPEGKRAAAEREDRRARDQSKADALMSALPHLDFASEIAVLNWLCEMQDPSDHIGVTVDRAAIVAAFKAAGFEPSVNCGEAYKANDRDNSFRWLVGQALDGLNGPAIHPIIHKFAEDWKIKFIGPGNRIQ